MPEKFRCPVCGAEVEVDYSENVISPLSDKNVKFLIHEFPSVHIVRVKYGGKWREPSIFLMSWKEGLHEVVPGSRDEITHYLLRTRLFVEEHSHADGAYLNPVVRAKILWKDHAAVGYYSEYTHTPVPTMAEIYVRPQYRGNGYAVEMVRDFLNSHPGPVAFYFIHRKCMRNLLMKVGLVQKNGDQYVVDNRIRLLSWQANPIPFWESDKYD